MRVAISQSVWSSQVSGTQLTQSSLPAPSALFGSNFYDPTIYTNPLDSANDTIFSVLLNSGGPSYASTAFAPDLAVQVQVCPDIGCPQPPAAVAQLGLGRLFWSKATTWAGTSWTPFPKAGDNVVIPYGWDLVLDTSTPALNRLTIEGNLTFSEVVDANLTAAYILVHNSGVLRIGGNGGLVNVFNSSTIPYPPPPPFPPPFALNGTNSTTAPPPPPPPFWLVNGSCWANPNATINGTYFNGTAVNGTSSSNGTLASPAALGYVDPLASAYYSRSAVISLTGSASSSPWLLTNTLSLGSKVLRISLLLLFCCCLLTQRSLESPPPLPSPLLPLPCLA